jgi:hypothetical protein
MVLTFTLAKDSVGDKQWTSLALSDIEVMNRLEDVRSCGRQSRKLTPVKMAECRKIFCDKVQPVEIFKPFQSFVDRRVTVGESHAR